MKFFKKLSNFPKFKSRKKSKPSFYHDTEKIKFKDGRVRIEKVGWIKLSEKTRIPENVKYTTPRVTFDGLNWFISVGIDVRLKDLAICSNIEKPFKNINKTSKVRKLEKQIKRVCNHLDNIRTNYRHQTTIEIVKTKPSQIVVENLNISGMMKNRHLSKAIWQQGLYDFKSILKSYK
jgi:putative transposase